MAADPIAAWATQRHALHTLAKVLRALDDAGVRAMPVKGIVLGSSIYDDVAQRPIVDVDLLVAPADVPRLFVCVRSRRWKLVWDSKVLGYVNFVVDGLAFDVAMTIGPLGVAAIGVRRFFDRASLGEAPLGFPHLRIELHDHVLLMALDAFKDRFAAKPFASEDLLRLTRSAGFRAEALVERAREARLCTVVAAVAQWLLDRHESEAWQRVRRQLDGAPLRRAYLQGLRERLASPPSTRFDRFRARVAARAASDSRARQLFAVALSGLGVVAFAALNRSLAPDPWRRRQRSTT